MERSRTSTTAVWVVLIGAILALLAWLTGFPWNW
jgi:hypothetical protein